VGLFFNYYSVEFYNSAHDAINPNYSQEDTMTITSALFFGTLMISLGLFIIYKKRVTISFSESDDSNQKEYTGKIAIIIGVILLICGTLILNSELLSKVIILSL